MTNGNIWLIVEYADGALRDLGHVEVARLMPVFESTPTEEQLKRNRGAIQFKGDALELTVGLSSDDYDGDRIREPVLCTMPRKGDVKLWFGASAVMMLRQRGILGEIK